MNNLLKGTPFSNALLAGLLTGIIAALLNLLYTVVYRNVTHFSGGRIFMPISIFIGFPVLLALLGSIYYLLRKYLHFQVKGFVLFCLAALLLFSLLVVMETQSDNGSLFSGLRGLSVGVIVISFLLGAFLIPYLAKHPDMYE